MSGNEVGPGGCECTCAQCDIGSHCGNKDNGCRYFEEEEEEDEDEEE